MGSRSGGISLTGILFIIFLILKLSKTGEVATWSWWWVTSPLWLPILLTIGIFIVIGFFMLIAFLIALLAGK